jgi:protein-disulfide isomerase
MTPEAHVMCCSTKEKNMIRSLGIIGVIGSISFASLAHAQDEALDRLFDDDAPPNVCVIAGPKTASITIEEYSDFECPYCAKGSSTVAQLLKDYPGKIRVVLRQMPLPMHANALVAAKAFTAVCQQGPDAAYAFQEKLFHNQDKLGERGEAFLFEAAKSIGANVDRMKVDMKSDAITQSLESDRQALERHGFNAVPSYVVGNEKIIGAQPLSEFKKLIDRQLKASKKGA